MKVAEYVVTHRAASRLPRSKRDHATLVLLKARARRSAQEHGLTYQGPVSQIGEIHQQLCAAVQYTCTQLLPAQVILLAGPL